MAYAHLRGLESFRQSLPKYRRYERHNLIAYRWDIVVALSIIERVPHLLEPLDVKEAARRLAFHLTPDDLGRQGLEADHYTAFYQVVPEAAMSEVVDLERPLLMAQVENDPRMQRTLLMDGYHRLYKAAQIGQPTLLYYTLTPQEERLCRY